jgi:predicted dehydrogenase
MKIGVVGNGMIVGMFLQDAAIVEGAEICALCVRPHSLEKGQKIAEEYHIPLVETDYEQFLKNPEIETVYVGIANLVHYEYAKKALEAGKHVILEKPFTVNGEEARTLSALAKENNLFIWEAFIIPYLPSYAVVKNAVEKVGNVKLIQANYSKISSRYAQYLSGVILPAFDLALAGGALYDLNIYNLHFTVSLFGKPKAAHYYATKGYNGVDTSGIAVLEYDDFNAVCCAGKDSTSPSGFVIQGDAGTLRGEGSVSTLSKICFSDKNGETTLAEFDGKIKLSYELAEFIRQFEAKDFASCYTMLDHSVAVAEVVDELLK